MPPGDINIAEPARSSVSPGRASSNRPYVKNFQSFQTAEFLLEHGFSTRRSRKDLKIYLVASIFSWRTA